MPPSRRSRSARVTSGGRSAAVMTPSRARSIARSTMCESSRTLPGNSYVREHLEHLGRDARRRAPERARRGAPMKCWTSSGMSPLPLAERRHAHRHDLQAEEEVLAETARRDLGLQVAVRRGDDAHVDLDRLGRADAPDLALLEHAQELHLHLRADLADLVEEERPAVGLLEEAALRGGRARERAPLVPEELTLEDRLGERRAVHRDERLVARGLFAWMARATSSLPVPLSPTMSTVAVVGATCATVLYTPSIAGAVPTICRRRRRARRADRPTPLGARASAAARSPRRPCASARSARSASRGSRTPLRRRRSSRPRCRRTRS